MGCCSTTQLCHNLMAEWQQHQERSYEDNEVQRTQLYAAIQAAQARLIDPSVLRRENELVSQLSGRSISLREQYGSNSPQPPSNLFGQGSLYRTRSAVRGPITDRRGLGTLAPFVLPGLLRRQSVGVPLEAQLSALQVLSSQSFNDNSPEVLERRTTSRQAAPKHPSGTVCVTLQHQATLP